MRHSASHVMADAVQRLRPNAKVAIGPSIENGFYYDFDTEPFAPEDAARIEAEMAQDRRREPAVRAPRGPARRGAASGSESRGEKYKVEIIESIPEGEEVSYFQHGDFIDLCRGPHVERTGDIKAFKVLSFAGAYWRGDERNAQLQRVYGTAFPSQAELDAHLAQHRGGEAPRPPHARQAARPVLVRRPGRPRLRPLAPEGRAASATRSRTSSGARTSAAATSWSTRRTSRASSCSRPRATSRTTRTTCSAAWSWTASATSSSR